MGLRYGFLDGLWPRHRLDVVSLQVLQCVPGGMGASVVLHQYSSLILLNEWDYIRVYDLIVYRAAVSEVGF